MAVHVFGIRHHGPGSARSLLTALNNLQPDILLVEGPPEGDVLIPLLADQAAKPPVALLVYAPKEPEQAAFFPFSVFSPEYQALRFAAQNHITARFMDLPQRHALPLMVEERKGRENENTPEDSIEPTPDSEVPPIRQDPLGALARAAGYTDGERWWERMIEQRQDTADLFEAILEAMTSLRNAEENPFVRKRDELREAYMRRILRKAIKEDYKRIAVVCGAWHAPALTEAALPPVSHDNAILKGMPRTRVTATLIPWTHSRLSMYSGYGAGIRSPGWYQHLWDYQADITASWLTRVAHLLREQDLVGSTAQVIDAVRMADTLATLRGIPSPGLTELNEATLTVLCNANPKPMELIAKKLIVGETMGEVPPDTPMVPLQRDFEQQQKSLRMRVRAEPSTLNLDLRKPMHLARSHLLHRLQLLGIHWGRPEEVKGKTGTFHEVWRLAWSPEMVIRLIEQNIWGNTVFDAATGYVDHLITEANHLPELTALMRSILWADLSSSIEPVIIKMEKAAALTGDVIELMQSMPSLIDIMLYGNVRQTETSMVATLVDGIFTRVTIGLPPACVALADDAAREIFTLFVQFHGAVRATNRDDYRQSWYDTLEKVMALNNVHGLLRGRCCRLLFDGNRLKRDDVVRHFRLATSPVNKPIEVASWLEGFLHNSGLILLHDHTLLEVIDRWVMSLDDETFKATVALLRRTFATFSKAERREIGRQISRIGEPDESVEGVDVLNEERAASVMPIIAALLGLEGSDHD